MKIFGAENGMWERQLKQKSPPKTDREINDKYDKGEFRIVTEINREKIPSFYEAISKSGYMDLSPFYQRRKRWDREKQSRLIESFIMNLPVPPVFLYEKNYNQYEVMDGQQRITALKTFYDNDLVLEGLVKWPELNGRKYKDLPEKIKAGIDRRTISSIVMLKESAPEEEDAILLRQLVFERLNTGGVELSPQEVRNAIYSGALNDLLERLSQSDLFRDAWRMPRHEEGEKNNTEKPIYENSLFKKMEDIELILRFFALRHVEEYRHGMQGFLDLYMAKSKKFSQTEIVNLEKLFADTIQLVTAIYGEKAFCPFKAEINEWADKPQKAIWDGVMVAFCEYVERSDDLIRIKEMLVEKTKQLFVDNADGTFTGRGNTKQDIKNRISKISEMLRGSVA